MSLLTIMSELWRLFKDNIIRILMGSIIVSLLATGGRYLLNQYLYGDVQSAASHLKEVFSIEPASFKAIITIEDGQILSNPHLYDDYFTSPEIVRQIESDTGIKFSETIDSEKALKLYKTPTYRGSIAGVKDNASGAFIFRFLVGKSASDNLKIAQAYQDLLESKRIEFAKKHNIDIIEDAVIGEKIDLEVYDLVPGIDTVNPYQTMSARPLIVYSILGFIIGLILLLGVVFLLRLGKSKIQYAFEYTWDIDDEHIIIKNEDRNIGDIISLFDHNKALVLSQQKLDTVKEAKVATKFSHFADDTIDVIYFILKSHQTDKQWYRENYQLAKISKKPIIIIHNI